ncbi:MAG: response regulator transcription factor [Lachnospiraceae bacterium]|mgnify:CR=1 FL=1|nr:response regulator transcription factor [Lachnospiraceae bacterium]
MHILIIEDDADFRLETAALLRNSLYRVTALEEFGNIAANLSSICPDLILLDLNLPGQSGFDICAKIRRFSDVPIIFVTGRSDSSDEVTALIGGGDDYITKPFPPAVLLAHITAVLKRAGKREAEPVLEHLGAQLDLARGCIRFQGASAELTKNELKILSCLFRHRESFVSRAELIEYLWDNSVFLDDNALSIHVTRIRGKLADLGLRDFIRTKRGMGYSI